MNYRLLAAFAAILIATLTTLGHAEPPKTETFMRLKLQHAHNLLDGIALEDFDQVKKSADAMILLSHESNWNVFQSPEYNEHSADFRRAAGLVVEQAKAKNLDGVTLGYLQMTMSCVRCHRYVRDQNGN